MRERERYRQELLQARLARITQGGASVREHRASQVHAARAVAPSAPSRKIPTYTYRLAGRPGRRALHDYTEAEVLRREQEFRVVVHRDKEGRIVSCRECPPAKWRSHIDTRQGMGLWRWKETMLDFDADGRRLRHRVRHR